MDASLAERLRAAGVDPSDVGDPAAAWERLHAALGTQATLLDRYELEALARGTAPDKLDAALRARLTQEVLRTHSPEIEFVDGSAREAEPIMVEPWDAGWPVRYEAWRGRIAESLGPAARRIEHVGSTAVPGLHAKPVIDIQVSVEDVEDESAYAPGLDRAGLVLRFREAGHRFFRPPRDRPRDVQVHVCAVGSTWERDHLRFRDYLRSHPEARDAYGRLKEELAERFRDDRIAYTEAKTAFILDALESAAAEEAPR